MGQRDGVPVDRRVNRRVGAGTDHCGADLNGGTHVSALGSEPGEEGDHRGGEGRVCVGLIPRPGGGRLGGVGRQRGDGFAVLTTQSAAGAAEAEAPPQLSDG